MNSVILIADQTFGMKIEDLPALVPKWVVDSPINHQALDVLGGTTRLHESVTTFEPRGQETPLQMASRIADSLDQHHNELAQVPPYDTLDLFGVEPDPVILERFSAYGFRSMVAGNGYVRLLKNP